MKESPQSAAEDTEWDSVAAGWEKWWPVFELGAQVVSDRMIDLAQIGPGRRVLDLATGIGEPALTAARLVGPGGMVVATDISGEMLAIAKRRAGHRGLKNIVFRRMDAEAVDLLDHDFDAILCRWGLFFLSDLKNALMKMRSRLRPDGKLVAAVWDKPQKVPALSLPMGVVYQILKRRPSPGPGVFSLCDTSYIERLLKDAGFNNVYSEEMTLTASFASADEFTKFTRDVSAPVRTLMADQPAEKQSEIWDAVTRAAEDFAAADGRIQMPLTAIIVTAL